MVKGIEEAKKNENGVFTIQNKKTGKYFKIVKGNTSRVVNGKHYKEVVWSDDIVPIKGKAVLNAIKRLTTIAKETEVRHYVIYPDVTEDDIEIIPLLPKE